MILKPDEEQRSNRKDKRNCFGPSGGTETFKKPILPQSNQTCSRRIKGKFHPVRSRCALTQFNLDLVENCVLETCGQITQENKIRAGLMELQQAMKRPIKKSAPPPQVQMESGGLLTWPTQLDKNQDQQKHFCLEKLRFHRKCSVNAKCWLAAEICCRGWN